MNLSLDNPSLARAIARIEMRRGWNEACFADDRIDHTVDITSVLPDLKPVSGHAPTEALLAAVVDGDLGAVLRELAKDSRSINDAIPGTHGKTLMHIAARLHGVQARKRLNEAHAYDQICSALLAAGADPLARDDIKQFPSSYTDGLTPPSLRDRMMRAAAEEQVGWESCAMRVRSRLNATHPWAGNGKGRLTREAKTRGTRAGFRA